MKKLSHFIVLALVVFSIAFSFIPNSAFAASSTPVCSDAPSQSVTDTLDAYFAHYGALYSYKNPQSSYVIGKAFGGWALFTTLGTRSVGSHLTFTSVDGVPNISYNLGDLANFPIGATDPNGAISNFAYFVISDHASPLQDGINASVMNPPLSTESDTSGGHMLDCVYQTQNVTYASTWTDPVYPTTAPPAIAPLNWDFTAAVTGLKVHFKADVYGVDPTIVMDWDLLGTNTFQALNPITDESLQTYVDPVTSNPVGYFVHHSSQEFDYTYQNVGVYDVGLDTTSSNGVHKFTHVSITVGGTGVYTTSAQNGSAPTKPKAACGLTDLPCVVSSLFTPDFDTINTSFNSLRTSFSDHLGFIAYPITWISSTFTYLMNFPDIPSCTLNFGSVYNVPYSLNYCIVEQKLPLLFHFAQDILIGVTSVFLIFELNKKLQGVLNK